MLKLKFYIGLVLVVNISFQSNLKAGAAIYDSLFPKIDENSNQQVSNDSLGFLQYYGLLNYQGYYPEIVSEILKYSLPAEIRIVRNEIFARKGYKFKDQALRDYFSSKSWYNPIYSNVNKIKLSNEDRVLLDTLLVFEKRNKNLTKQSLRKEFKQMLLERKEFSLVLWYRFISTENNLYDKGAHDFFTRYSIKGIETVFGIYNCVLSDWCGAEGPSCTIQMIYVLDNDLNKLDFYLPSSSVGIRNVKKIGEREFSFTKIYFDEIIIDDNGVSEYCKSDNGLVYRIDKNGKLIFEE